VHAIPVNHAELKDRTVRIHAILDFADLRPGDELASTGRSGEASP
jgi:hypothetical protein